MAKDNRITFFDLQHASGATTSPFVWATKYALEHKGFDFDVVDGGFDLYSAMSPPFGLKPRPADPEPFAKGPTPVGGLISRNTGPTSTAAETAKITGQKETASHA